jgi:hypothetical protein
MKWLFVCLAVFFIVAPAMAGEDPYIAVVGSDNGLFTLKSYFFGIEALQFLYPQADFGVPTCVAGATVPAVSQFMRIPSPAKPGCESFFSQTPMIQKEVCNARRVVDEGGFAQLDGNPAPVDPGFTNAKTPAGNAGWYEWWIRLPKKPSGEINIVIKCGVLKPNAHAVYDFNAVKLCAAETGERVGYGVCVRQEVDPGVSPVNNTALPRITAIAYPGPYNTFTSFNLTAFKNPSTYTLAFDPVTAALSNSGNSQLLDGSSNARILLKACMDKTVVTKLPVTGQINALNQVETDLEAGDFIQVRMDVPRQNTVDIYCNPWSARLQGVGESPF